MRLAPWIVAVAVLALVGSLPSSAAALCLTMTNQSSGQVVLEFAGEVTGSVGNFYTLALFDRVDQRASQGTAYVDGADVRIGVSRPGGQAIVTFSCRLDLVGLTGTCSQNVVFPNPANGTDFTANRNATLTLAGCP